MRIVFFGTPYFSAAILKYLLENKVEIAAVVCQPSNFNGENNAVYFLAKKFLGEDKILSPENAADMEFLNKLRSFKADLFVVVSYGQILKQALLDIPPLGCVNIHGSLLPKYRGAAPIQRAIMNGDKKTGVTIMKMTAKMDAGDIMVKKEVNIGVDDNYRQVEEKMYNTAAPLILEVLNDFSKFRKEAYPQDEKEVTFASKILKEDFFIDWKDSAVNIHNKVRALYPNARCFAHINGKKKMLKILKTVFIEGISSEAGAVVKKDSFELVIGCGKGVLGLLQIQLEGKRPLSIKEFLNGVRGDFKIL
jgi:methionyl-tRNA formyltransferase